MPAHALLPAVSRLLQQVEEVSGLPVAVAQQADLDTLATVRPATSSTTLSRRGGILSIPATHGRLRRGRREVRVVVAETWLRPSTPTEEARILRKMFLASSSRCRRPF